jgi:hypothetical protein
MVLDVERSNFEMHAPLLGQAYMGLNLFAVGPFRNARSTVGPRLLEPRLWGTKAHINFFQTFSGDVSFFFRFETF